MASSRIEVEQNEFVKQRFDATNTPRHFTKSPDTDDKIKAVQLQKRFIALMIDDNNNPVKCFCSGCRKTFDGDYENISRSPMDIPIPDEINCPECGEPQATYISTAVDGVYHMPTVNLGGYSYEYDNKQTGSVARQDFNIVTQQINIDANTLEVSSWQATETSLIIDYEDRNIQNAITFSNQLKPNGTMLWDSKNTNTLNSTNPYAFTKHLFKKNDGRMQRSDDATEGAHRIYLNITPHKLYAGENVSPLMSEVMKHNIEKNTRNPINMFKPIPGTAKITDSVDIAAENARTNNARRLNGMALSNPYDIIDANGFNKYSDTFVKTLKATLAQKFIAAGVDPAYVNWHNNCLFCKMPIYDNSTEQTNRQDIRKQSEYLHMMIRYPAAFEHACNRVDAQIENKIYADFREAKADGNTALLEKYKALDADSKDPAAAAAKKDAIKTLIREYDPVQKAKMFREEAKVIADQLSACQPEILKTISEAKNAKEMVELLQYHAFGDDGGSKKNRITDTKMPSHIRGAKTNEDGTLKNTVPATNTMIASFKENPITTANTCSLLSKLAIYDPSLRSQVIQTAERYEKDKQDVAKHNKESLDEPFNTLMRGGTIYLHVTNEGRSFFRSWVKNYSADKNADGTPNTYSGQKHLIDELFSGRFDDSKESTLIDTIDGWDKVRPQKNNPIKLHIDSRSTATNVTQKSPAELITENIRNYCLNMEKDPKTVVSSAYRDFAKNIITMNGLEMVDDTITNPATGDIKTVRVELNAASNETKAKYIKDTVDGALRTIKRDHELTQYKEYYDANPEENMAVINSNPILKAVLSNNLPEDKRQASDAKTLIENYTPVDEREVYVEARNRLPFFQGQTLQELHDEISVVGKKSGKNDKLQYDQDTINRIEGSYPISPDDPNNKITFRIMKDRFDYIKTSNALHNCVATMGYFDRAKGNASHASPCIVGIDNQGRRIACIELSPYQDENDDIRYHIKQIQGTHDSKLDAKYAYAATEWVNDKQLKPYTANMSEFTVFCDYDENQEKYVAKQNYDVTVNTNLNYDDDTIDFVDNISMRKDAYKNKQKTRDEFADAIFGVNQSMDPPVYSDVFGFDLQQTLNHKMSQEDINKSLAEIRVRQTAIDKDEQKVM